MKSLFLMAVIALMFASCSGSKNGYGCKGKESWNKMTRRINNGY